MIGDFSLSSYINMKLNSYLEDLELGVFFGQNVMSGSRIAGLGLGVELQEKILSFNTPNSENSLFGLGFGLSISGIPSVYLMKQHDFSLLALDHLVNTRKLLQNYSNLAAFLAVMVVVDSGYEGPQSNLNNLDDLYSLSQADIWLLENKCVIDNAFASDRKDFEIFAISQRNLKLPLISENPSITIGGFQVLENNLTEDCKPVIVNCGLSTEAFNSCLSFLHDREIDFHIARQFKMNLEENLLFIERLAARGRKFVIVDGSKSRNRISTHLAYALLNLGSEVLLLGRQDLDSWRRVSQDNLQIDMESVLDFLRKR